MKFVKCLYTQSDMRFNITKGKIYKVNKVIDSNNISIIDDLGYERFYLIVADRIWFEDATQSLRDNKNNKILK